MTEPAFLIVPFSPPTAALSKRSTAHHDLTAMWRATEFHFHVHNDPDLLISANVRSELPPVLVAHGSFGPKMLRLVKATSKVADRGTRVVATVVNLDDRMESDLFHAGAQDVMALPAPLPRLRARLEAHLRQAVRHRNEELILTRGQLRIHLGRREVSFDGTPLELTKAEFDLLATLARRPLQVLSKGELMSATDEHRSARSLESHLSRLRAKLVGIGGPRLIEPVRGVGYRLGTL